VHCGKHPLSTVKELFSSVDALLKVTNLKRFENQSRVVRCGKYTLSTAKKRFQLICRTVESNYFPQLRSIFYKRCTVESAYFPQLTGAQFVSKIHSRFAFDPAQSRSRDCFQQHRTRVQLKRLQELQWSSVGASEW
jgi:hypothetical protein